MITIETLVVVLFIFCRKPMVFYHKYYLSPFDMLLFITILVFTLKPTVFQLVPHAAYTSFTF